MPTVSTVYKTCQSFEGTNWLINHSSMFFLLFFLSLLCLMYSAYWVLSHRETNIHTHGHTKEQFRVAEWPCKQGFRMCEGATVPGAKPTQIQGEQANSTHKELKVEITTLSL